MGILVAEPPKFQTGQGYVDELQNAALEKSFGSDQSAATSTAPSAAPQQDSLQAETTNTSGGSSLGPGFQADPRAAPQSLSFGTYSPDVGSYGKLFEPLTKGLQEGGNALKTAGDAFNTQAGAGRTYGIDIEKGLDQILGGLLDEKTRPQSVQSGKDLLGASYGGPMDLEGAIEGDDVARAQGQVQELQTQAQSLSGGGGIEALLKQLYPQLSAGQVFFESRGLRGDEGFNQARQSVQGSTSQLLADILRGQGESQAIGQERTAQEKGVAEGSRKYVEGKQQGIYGDIDAEVGKKQAEQDATLEAFRKLMETGNLSDLDAVPQDVRGDLDSGDFQTEARTTAEGIPAEIEAINQRYQDLNGIPPLTIRINSHGREQLDFPKEWWTQHKGEHSTAEWNSIKTRARERQADLVRAGFDPRDENVRSKAFLGVKTNVPEVVKGGSLKSTINPLYFGQEPGWQPEDIRGFLTFDPGVSPARENIATEDQRKLISGINEILDISNADLSDPEEAYRKASLMADVKTYLDREQAELDRRKGDLTAEAKHWAQQVKDARHKFVEAAASDHWTKVITGIFSINPAWGFYLGGSQIGNAVGPALGKAST